MKSVAEKERKQFHLPHRLLRNEASAICQDEATTVQRQWCKRPSSSWLWQRRLGMTFHRATCRHISLERRTIQPRRGTQARQRHDLQPAERLSIFIFFLKQISLPGNLQRLLQQLQLLQHIRIRELLASLAANRLHPSEPSNLESLNRCNEKKTETKIKRVVCWQQNHFQV